MTEQPSFRYMSLTVGTFILVTLLVFAVVILEAGRVHHWFRIDAEVRVKLPKTGSFGLKEGDAVMLLGTDVGRVSAIQIDPDGKMHAEITIATEFMPFVRTDSVALIKKRFGVAGDAFLEISRGEGAVLDPVSPTLVARADGTPTEIIELVMNEIRNELSPAIRDLRTVIQSGIRLAAALEQPTRELDTLLHTLNAVASRVDRGEGSIGMLFADDSIARNVRHATAEIDSATASLGPILNDARRSSSNISALTETLRASTAGLPATVENVDGTLAELRGLLVELRAVAQALPTTARSVDRAAADLPGLMLQTQATLRETERLLERMQRHWLLGGTPSALPAAVERIPAAESVP